MQKTQDKLNATLEALDIIIELDKTSDEYLRAKNALRNRIAFLEQKIDEGITEYREYVGDTCKHGVYVGGVAFDHLCPGCEGKDYELIK